MQKKWAIATFVVIGLSACSSTGVLTSPLPEDKISGTVTRGLIQPYRVEVMLDGKTYRGEWRRGDPTPAQMAATSQPHKYHVAEVRSVLTADDGSKLDCRWDIHSDTGIGQCRSGQREYPLNLK